RGVGRREGRSGWPDERAAREVPPIRVRPPQRLCNGRPPGGSRWPRPVCAAPSLLRSGEGAVRPLTGNGREVGAAGEVLAAGWLERAGFRILARNYRCPGGE